MSNVGTGVMSSFLVVYVYLSIERGDLCRSRRLPQHINVGCFLERSVSIYIVAALKANTYKVNTL
jgi:hypothetical protein